MKPRRNISTCLWMRVNAPAYSGKSENAEVESKLGGELRENDINSYPKTHHSEPASTVPPSSSASNAPARRRQQKRQKKEAGKAAGNCSASRWLSILLSLRSSKSAIKQTKRNIRCSQDLAGPLVLARTHPRNACETRQNPFVKPIRSIAVLPITKAQTPVYHGLAGLSVIAEVHRRALKVAVSKSNACSCSECLVSSSMVMM